MNYNQLQNSNGSSYMDSNCLKKKNLRNSYWVKNLKELKHKNVFWLPEIDNLNHCKRKFAIIKESSRPHCCHLQLTVYNSVYPSIVQSWAYILPENLLHESFIHWKDISAIAKLR